MSIMPRRRLLAASGAVLSILIALLAIVMFPPAIFRPIGDVAYVVAIACGIIMLSPRAIWWLPPVISIIWTIGVEFFQLTGLPAAWSQHSILAWLIFGSRFDPLDLLAYAVGFLVAAAIAWLIHYRLAKLTTEN